MAPSLLCVHISCPIEKDSSILIIAELKKMELKIKRNIKQRFGDKDMKEEYKKDKVMQGTRIKITVQTSRNLFHKYFEVSIF